MRTAIRQRSWSGSRLTISHRESNGKALTLALIKRLALTIISRRPKREKEKKRKKHRVAAPFRFRRLISEHESTSCTLSFSFPLFLCNEHAPFQVSLAALRARYARVRTREYACNFILDERCTSSVIYLANIPAGRKRLGIYTRNRLRTHILL